MTDSIPSSLFQGLPPLPPEQPDGDVVRIEQVTGELRAVARAIRIAGEVIRHNRDGTILIHTDKGDITVRPRGGADFKDGEQVEIDIPPGRPPRQAVVREAPPLPQTQVSAEPLQTTQTQQPSDVAPPRPPARTVSDLTPQEYAPPDKSSAPETVPVRPGDIIRLVPLPPEIAAQIVQPETIMETAVSTPLPNKAEFVAALVAAAMQDEQIGELVRIAVKDAPIPAPEIAPRLPLTTLFTQEPVPSAVKLPPSQKTIIEQILLPLLKHSAAAPDFLTLPVTDTGTLAPRQAAPVFQFLKEAAAQAPLIRLVSPQAQTIPAGIILRTTLPQAAAPVDAQKAPLFPRTAIHNLPLILPVSVLGKDVIAEFVIRGTSPLITTSAQGDFPPPVVSGRVFSQAAPLPDTRIVNLAPPAVFLSEPGKGATSVIVSPRAFPAANPFFAALVDTAQRQDSGAPTAKAEAIFSRIAHASALTIAAPVVGVTPETHHPVIVVPVPGQPQPPALFSVPFAAPNLPAGTVMELEVLPGFAPAADESGAMTAMLPTLPWQLFTDFNWPVLDDVRQVLQQQGLMPVVQSMTHTIMPDPAAVSPARVPAAALFFIAAVRAGDMAGWLGEKTIDALRRAGRDDLVSRISRDFSGLQRSDTDPVAQDWRAMSVPLSWQNEVHKMMIYYRRDENDKDKEGGKKKESRFIIEISPPRMGMVQLDGLHRAKKLDLIVRTQKTMGPAMKQALRRLWVNALEQTNLNGEISFQSKPEQFVRVDVSSGRGGALV